MSVYVDDMRAPFGRMIMCHMLADTREELDAMADAIGVGRRWIQYEGTPREHYDVSLGCRKKAVRLGAIEITSRQAVELIERKRMMPDADGWLPMESAPRDATWVLGRLAGGTSVRMHFAEDLSGEYQPAFSGWFQEVGNGYRSWFVGVRPTGWKAEPATAIAAKEL